MKSSKHDYETLNDEIPVYGFGVRHVQVVLVFFWNLLGFTMAGILATCIVAMTDPTASPNPSIPTFPQWTDQSLVLSSFGWGLAGSQPFGGHFAKKYGTKWFFILTMIAQVLTVILTPFVTVYFGSTGLIILCVIQGLFRGFGLSMLPVFINLWVPVAEKTTLGNIVFAAFGPGCIFATNISGALSSSNWGWPSVFYLNAALGTIWIILMLIYGVNIPEANETMSKHELLYITYKKKVDKEIALPWDKCLRSKAIWAVFVAHCGGSIIWWLSYAEFPMYISGTFRLSVGLVSEILTLAYTVSWLSSLVAGKIIDYFNNNGIVKIGSLRKIANSIATVGPAIFLIWMSYLKYNDINQALFLVIGLFITSSTYSCGCLINYNDISPNFCGVLFGIGSTLSVFSIQIAVTVVQFAVTDQHDPSQWALVFWFCSLVAVSCNIVYTIYGSGEILPWDSEAYEGDDQKTPSLESSSSE